MSLINETAAEATEEGSYYPDDQTVSRISGEECARSEKTGRKRGKNAAALKEGTFGKSCFWEMTLSGNVTEGKTHPAVNAYGSAFEDMDLKGSGKNNR